MTTQRTHHPGAAATPRRLSQGMRLLLYVLTALTFIAGTQLFVLSELTDVFFPWAVTPPVGAAFVDAGFWSASVVVLWAARQRDSDRRPRIRMGSAPRARSYANAVVSLDAGHAVAADEMQARPSARSASDLAPAPRRHGSTPTPPPPGCDFAGELAA